MFLVFFLNTAKKVETLQYFGYTYNIGYRCSWSPKVINIIVDTRAHPLFVRPEGERPSPSEMVDFIYKLMYSPDTPYSQYVLYYPNDFENEAAYLADCQQKTNIRITYLKNMFDSVVGDIDNDENFRKIFTETNRITRENIASNVCVRQWSTIGDLHASALKFLYFLLLQGIATIDNNPDEVYAAFRREYETSFKSVNPNDDDSVAEAKASRASFDENILPHIRITPGARVRDIGDDMADRCGNEYMMLKLFELLIDYDANLEILLSNHSKHFIIAMEEVLNDPNHTNILTGTYVSEFGSVHRLRKLIASGVVTLDEIKVLYEKYKAKLKAFSYDYSDAGQLVIYGHAPMNELDILDIAQHLSDRYTHFKKEEHDAAEATGKSLVMTEEQYNALSPLLIRLNSKDEILQRLQMLQPEDIISLINHINGIVQTNANQNTLYDILSAEKILRQQYEADEIDEDGELAILYGTGIDPLVYGLHYSTHNRDNPSETIGALRREATGAERPKNPNVIIGHGHHTQKYEHCMCYDNNLCKSKDMTVGILNISLSHPNKPDLVNKDAPVVPIVADLPGKSANKMK
jgi:hypothetical protein